MSTRMTIRHGDGFHLYAECLENAHVYLLVDSGDWVESHGSEFYRETCRERGDAIIPPKEMVLRIPREVAEKLFASSLPILGEGNMPLRDVPSFSPPLRSTLVDESPTVDNLKRDISSMIRALRRLHPFEAGISFDQPLSTWTLQELTK